MRVVSRWRGGFGQLRVASRWLFLSLLFAYFPGPRSAFALDPSKRLSQYLLSSWNVQDGFDQKAVMGVAQTQDGFLWLATENGLVRFDGRTFVTFDEKNAPGLGDRFVRSLSTGPDGSLWIGTMSGLAHYRNGRFESFRNEPETRIDIYDLCAAQDGSVWFSSDRGLRHLDGNSLRNYTMADGLPSNSIGGIAEGKDGTIWVATGKGLVSFRAGKFTTYSSWNGVPSPPIEAVAVGRGGVVWAGTRDGRIGRWKAGSIAAWWDGGSTKGARVNSLKEDRDGNVWIAFENIGLARMQDRRLELFQGLESDSPDWVFEDRESDLWVGWEDAGVSMLRDGRFTNVGKQEGLTSNSVASVMQAADGSLWVGTRDAGLNRVEGENVRSYSIKDGLPDKRALGLLQQHDGTLWIGSGAGSITELKRGQFSTIRLHGPLSPEVPTMAEDHGGNLWFGFDMPNGLFRLRDRHLESVPIEGRVKALAVAPDGALWIASYLHGLVRLKDGKSTTFSLKDGLSSIFLTSVYVDPQGVVWAGTALAGLNRLKDGKITHYGVDQGLSDNSVRAVEEDDFGYLWLGGARGISRIRLEDLNDYADGRINRVRSDVYGYSDGLRSMECTSIAQPAIAKDSSGRLWFTTTAGLAMIDPRHIRENDVSPLAEVESITADGKPASSIHDGLRIGPGSGQVEIAFTAPSFVRPDQMHLRYRLVGVEGDWIDAQSRRIATYSNLAPGNYRFEVMAFNSDGRGSDKPTVKEFEILPHYYQTRLFRGLCVLGILLLIWRVYVSRVRHFVRKTENLEGIVEQRTAQLRKALEEAETAKHLLRDQAMRDSLTGFWNRRVIMEMLDSEASRCKRDNESLCIVMADLDHFKGVNDSFGHLAGDVVLRGISDSLRRGVRRHEAIGRYGGEEFLILLPGCPFAVAIERAEALRNRIQANPIALDDRSINVTCSFGIAEYVWGAGVEQLVAKADEALYDAKNTGRNCVRPEKPTPSGMLKDPVAEVKGSVTG
jgi:diguanylate cyclase (GGDEF)-like protein